MSGALKPRFAARGLVVSLDIPFGEDGAIDFPALERLVDFHLREGAIGFLVPAQAAEVFDLTLAERLDVLRAVRSASCGRGLVVAGATSANLDESLAVAKEAARCGCEGVLAEPPAACPQTIQHMLEFFRPLADAGPPCLMIQDLDWHGSGLPVELVVELYHQLPQFGSLKVEVNPAGPKYTAVREATQGKLHLSGGWAALQMIEALDRGVDVFMNTALTRLYRAVIDAYDAGDRPAALRHFYRMLPVLAFTRQHLDVSIHFHKRQFQHLGIFPTARVRKAGLAWDAFFEKQTVDLLAYIDQLYEEARVSPR